MVLSTLNKLTCQKFPVPPFDGEPKDCLDLDTTTPKSFLDQGKKNVGKRGDCLVHYNKDGTAIIELKRSYMKKTKYQLSNTISILRDDWNGFLITVGMSLKLPFPRQVILCMENGLGHDRKRYEVDKNHFLREKSSKGKFSGPFVDCEGIYLQVYNRREIEQYYETWGVK